MDGALNTVAAIRKAVLANGYQPVAVKTGEKVPAGTAWQMRRGLPPISDIALNTGIICEGLCPADIDVDDADAVEAIVKVFDEVAGHTPLVRGRPNSPRRLLLYRAPDGTRPKKRVIKLGSLGKVELLGLGQQFVAYGMHPSGVEFEWPEAGPDIVKRSDMLVLTPEHEAEIERRLRSTFDLVAEAPEPAPTQPRAAPAQRPDNIGTRERAAFEAALDAEVRNVATAGEGQRNHTLNTAAFCLAQMVASGWGSRQEVETALTEAAFTVGLRQPEIGKTIRSGINSGMAKPRPPLGERDGYGDAGADIEIRLTKVGGVTINAETGEVADGEAEEDELETIPACEFAGIEPPPRDWHVPDLVPARTVTILTGDGATGKSLLALQLAVATAAGTRWIGNDVKPGRALFLTAEDEIDEAHRRLIAITDGEDVDLSGLGTLRIASLAGKEALLAVPKDRSGVLTTTPLFRKLACTIDRHRPAVVVLDTLADLFGGNEIDRAQARQFIGFLRSLAIDYDTTIVLLAHPSLSGMASGSGNSGSTAWNNSARSRLYLHRVLDGPDQKESDPDVRVLSTVKANYGKSGGKIELRWSEGRFIPESEAWKVDIHLGPLSPSKAEEVFLKLLKNYLSNGINVAAGSSPNYAPRVFANDERSEGVSMKAFKKAMHDLIDRGIIDNVIYGPPSKGHRRLDFALPKSI